MITTKYKLKKILFEKKQKTFICMCSIHVINEIVKKKDVLHSIRICTNICAHRYTYKYAYIITYMHVHIHNYIHTYMCVYYQFEIFI